jgi:Protein of unknown function (DUF2846)
MKAATTIFCLLIFATVASAQNPDPNKWMCRNLSDSGGFTYQGESIFGTVACRPVAQATPKTQEVASTTAPAPAVQPQPAAAPAQPVASAPAASSDQTQATIYFYRPRRFQGSALKPSVFVDDARAGSLHNGDSIKLPLAPGDHRIYSTDKSTGLDLNAKPGETYYVRVDIQVGFWKGHGGVTLVDPQQGKYEVAQAAHQGADGNQ